MFRAIGAIVVLVLGISAVGCHSSVGQRYVYPDAGADYYPQTNRPAGQSGATASGGAGSSSAPSGDSAQLTSPSSSTALDADRGQPVTSETTSPMTP